MDNRTIITAYSTNQEGRYEYYALESGRESPHRLLEQEHELVVNLITGCITLVDWKEMHFQAQTSFTSWELALIRQLFEDSIRR